jgi:hypothetical protein
VIFSKKLADVSVSVVNGQAIEMSNETELPLKHLIIDFSCVNYIDSEGVNCLKQVSILIACQHFWLKSIAFFIQSWPKITQKWT